MYQPEYFITPRVPGVRPADPPDFDGVTFVYVFTQVLDPWVMPAVQGNVVLVVANAQGFVAGMTIVIENAGYFEVVSTDALDRMTVMNFGTTYNQPPGSSILPGKITTTSLPGPPGATGSVGPAGPQGIQGPAGPPLNVKGTVATSSALPSSGNNTNDLYITADTGHAWAWTGAQWIDLGPFRGPVGPAGSTGPAGPQGVQGPQGAIGPQGAPGPAGTTIATTTAANFTQPAVNANVSVTLSSGAGIAAGLILYIQGGGYYSVQSVAGSVATVQNLGYATINTSPGTVINSGANVGGAGPQGPAGAAGSPGAQGATGPTGATGPQGIQGIQGVQGIQGTQGIQGVNAYNATAGGFTVPPTGSTVTVTLNDASWVVVGELLYIGQAGSAGQAGTLQVTAKTGNQLTLLNPY